MKTKPRILSIIMLVSTVLFTSCYIGVDKNGNIVTATVPKFSDELHLEDFMDLQFLVRVRRADESLARATDYFDETIVYVDRNTDVIYLSRFGGYKGTMTPIYKPDGTLLTYTEWKEQHK